jgi:hypothetical protein
MAVTSLVARYVLMDKLKAFMRDNFTDGTYSIDVCFYLLEMGLLVS